MVVIAECQASSFGFLARSVERLGELLESIKAAALLGRNVRQHNKLKAFLLDVGNGSVELGPAFEEKRSVQVNAHGLELRLFESRPDFFEIAVGGFYFAVADILNRFQNGSGIGADGVAYG